MEWIFGLLDNETITEFLGKALQYEVTKFTMAFILAWKIVKRDMSKDMAKKFDGVTFAINGVTAEVSAIKTTLAKDLDAHSNRLKSIEDKVVTLTSRVDTLEKGESNG